MHLLIDGACAKSRPSGTSNSRKKLKARHATRNQVAEAVLADAIDHNESIPLYY